MNIVTCDLETYFDADYSLKSSKLNMSEYVRHELFKIHCAAIKVDRGPTRILYGDAIETGLLAIDWSNSALLAHNTSFDGFILSHHYHVVPRYYYDTLGMARAIHSNSISAGLDSVATFYGVGNKVPDVLQQTKGLRDLPYKLLTNLGAYCAVDVDLCYEIFHRMRSQISDEEMDLISLTVAMFCDPLLKVDITRAEQALKDELEYRAMLIAKCGLQEKDLRSANKFAEGLLALGVQPPTKTSPRTNETAFAFAKGDLDFQKLLVNPVPEVRDLVRARMAAKSTIDETRAIRFIEAGKFGWSLPVLLNYFGAHTSRWTAGNKMNMQNLPRGGELRKSIVPPAGMRIIACDSRQIEARVLAWLAGHVDLLHLFEMDDDVYRHQAAIIYGIDPEDVTDDQRFVGKVCVLGLGYGMGVNKFQYTLAAGLMGPPVTMRIENCREIVGRYRTSNLPIAQLWSIMESVLAHMVLNVPGIYKCFTWQKDKLVMPNNVMLQYPNLIGEYDEVEEKYFNFRYYTLEEAVKHRMRIEAKSKKIYGGLLTENVTQALARIIVANQALEIAKRYRIVMLVHDEIVCVAPEKEFEEAKAFMLQVMSESPAWGLDIPLSAEIKDNYG